jgi:N-acetylglutamate synthase-like GNAT family acetyltransferase
LASTIPVNNRRVQITVRRAREDDQPVITAMVRRARLNPAGLHWERFVIAERDSRAVGVAQLRRHSDGAIELASLVVEPESRGHGIAMRMVDALLADEPAPVYTLIDRRFMDHFTRWGFAPVDPRRLPSSVSRGYLIGRVATAVGSVLRRQRIRIVPLLRPAR